MTHTDAYLANRIAGDQALRNGETVLRTTPRKLNVALTTRCNIACVMCEVRKRPWEIPERTLREIVAWFPTLERVIWQGGEVFLHDGFRALLEQARQYPRLSHEITTNAHLLTDDWIDLLSGLPVELNVSIDGTDAAVYERIRAGSRFGRIRDVLSALAARPSRGARVMLVTVMRSNAEHLRDMVSFAARYRFSRIILQPVKANAGSDENIFAPGDARVLSGLVPVVDALAAGARAAGIELVDCLPLPRPPAGRADPVDAPRAERAAPLFCHAPWQQFFIEWGGDAYPHCLCLSDGDNARRAVGSVLDRSLDELWNAPRMQEYRQRMVAGTHAGLCNPECVRGQYAAAMRNLSASTDGGYHEQ